ncbi:MAG TPA: protease modulator HflK [Myxococcota bacterium]|nr:protease modulator HflK [Myxococcota bacterium]
MRQTASAASELGRLAAPLAGLFDAAWRRMHWWVAAMALLYAVSGISVIRADEVAIVLRWGRLVGDAPATQQHGPGLLFAFPRPVDRVVRVKTKHISEQSIQTLAGFTFANTLNPVWVGYALTGDQNVLHVAMTARYQVRDPVDWALYGPPAEDILRVEVTAAMVRSLGEIGVDRVLAEGRKPLIDTATRRAQAGLDEARSGLALISLELTDLSPPAVLSSDFDAVQSAYIEMETKKKEAEAYAQDLIPKAQAAADQAIQTARADAAGEHARASGDADAFRALERQYRANPAIVRERLYRDAIDQAVRRARVVRWVPPPAGGRDQHLRIPVSEEEAGERAAPPPEPAAPKESP